MKIIGQLVCGPGEADRWLKETLEEFKRLCDDVVVVTCNAGYKEKKLIKKYDFWQYEDNRVWGRYQPDIKTELVKKIYRLKPDWVLPLDGDETLPTVSRSDLEQITTAEGRDHAVFYVTNLWNDEQHYAKGLSFWNVRFYQALPDKGTQFQRQPVHCGNAPPYFYSNNRAKITYVPHILLHKGLMLPEDRQRKYDRYQLFDPEAKYKSRDWYESLLTPASGSEYNQQAVLEKLRDYCAKL
jgi:hypothetical protein